MQRPSKLAVKLAVTLNPTSASQSAPAPIRQRLADALGIDRSKILRDALHRYLVELNSEADAQRWEEQPATESERSLEAIADWGPAEDWSEWADAEG